LVTTCATHIKTLTDLLQRFGMTLDIRPENVEIEGSFWGDSEAGLLGNKLVIRSDTPVHSALHEACHYICMDNKRRTGLHTDAGGDYDEENGVCCLQIILADYLHNYTREQMMADMDAWGYTFRLGSAQSWFTQDADDAFQWLTDHQIINQKQQPTWCLRD